ncbi:MAG: helix-turn-helix transcriptional regulator [Bacteroides sp.]|nr:helix-turn-helix transcriptional regulator [Bacteroides sp.]MCM1094696.1 helix-turn-helix transcriptional regulator [Terasakiella sp.]
MSSLPPQENLKKFACTESCPVRNVISRFSGKWALLILCVLAEAGATRFNSTGRAIPDISPKVLAETLKNLEADGFVTRKMYAEIPPRVEYSLTPLGQSLMPVVAGLVSWSLDHYGEIMAHRRKTN